MTETNPYAAPADLSAAAVAVTTGSYFRDGEYLIVRDGAEFPEVCLITNQAAPRGSWRKKVQIAWTPPWVFILILVSPLVLILVMLLTQKKAKIAYSLSAEGRGRITHRRNIGFILLAAFSGSVAYAIGQEGPGWISGVASGIAAVLVITSLVFFIIANPIKALKYKDGWFRVKGCSKDFLATLPQHPSPF